MADPITINNLPHNNIKLNRIELPHIKSYPRAYEKGIIDS
jgi:hypothetical protein